MEMAPNPLIRYVIALRQDILCLQPGGAENIYAEMPGRGICSAHPPGAGPRRVVVTVPEGSSTPPSSQDGPALALGL